MKATTIILMILLVLTSSTSFAQMPIQDRNSRYQRERMVFQRWNAFRPKWYFRLFHNRYRKGPDRRNVRQLAPTLFLLNRNAGYIAGEQKETNEWESYKLAQQANIMAESHYHIYFRQRFGQMQSRFSDLYQRCMELEVSEPTLQELSAESAMLKEYLNAVREGNTEPGASREAMKEILKDYGTLVAMARRIVEIHTTKMKIRKKGIPDN